MVPAARWLVVAAVALGVTSVPLVPRVLPVGESSISAAGLADRIADAVDLGWSGEVRSQGFLQVPVTGQTFGGIGRLLGDEAHLRVWWRDHENWRIARIRATGESNLARDSELTVQWNYEENHVNLGLYAPIRLPEDVDVIPAELAARLLAGARPDELSRLPARRVAGRDAAGLRLLPSDERSTISRVDVWVDQSSGLPLQVKVYGEPAGGAPILDTRLERLTLERPAETITAFQLSSSLDFSQGAALDEVAGADALAPLVTPDVIADLPLRGRPSDFGAVGVYGRGPMAILAVPLRRSVAEKLRAQLRRSRDVRVDDSTVALEVGPISVRLLEGRGSNFLLTGTVTPETLSAAGIDLVRDVRRTG